MRQYLPRLGIGLAGVALLALLLALIAYLPAWLLGVRDQGAEIARLSPQDRIKAINDLRGVFLQVLAGLGLALTIYFTARTFLLNRQGQVNDRFTKAIEQLGQRGPGKLDVRLGGIYALEQIARDSRELHGPVVEILCAFLRQHARPSAEAAAPVAPDTDEHEEAGPKAEVAADLQAAITVLGRRNVAQDVAGQPLDLRKIALPAGATFWSAQLQGASFDGAQLQEALFEDAQLQGARFDGAQLQEASFEGAQLQEASFWSAQLQGARFDHAQLQGLQGTRFEDAQLRGARFDGAQLPGFSFDAAELQDASFDRAELQEASFWRAQLQGASFWSAQLQRASFEDAQLQGANFGGARLQAARFWSAQLRRASFDGAQLEGARFDSAKGLTLAQLRAGVNWRKALLPNYLLGTAATAESASELTDAAPESAPGQVQTPSD